MYQLIQAFMKSLYNNDDNDSSNVYSYFLSTQSRFTQGKEGTNFVFFWVNCFRWSFSILFSCFRLFWAPILECLGMLLYAFMRFFSCLLSPSPILQAAIFNFVSKFLFQIYLGTPIGCLRMTQGTHVPKRMPL